MKTIKEICKEVGVTRKTLRLYKEKGLVKPSNIGDDDKNEDKIPWEYEDDAIDTLFLIKIFKEVGYSLEEIKQKLEMVNVHFQTEVDHMIDKLIAKKHYIDGLIIYLIDRKSYSALPQKTREVLEKVDLSEAFRAKSIYKVFDENMIRNGSLAEKYHAKYPSGVSLAENREMIEFGGMLSYQLIALGLLYGENPNSELISEFTKQAMIYFNKVMTDQVDEEGGRVFEEVSESERVALLYFIMKTFLLEELMSLIEEYYGSSLKADILDAIYCYGVSLCKDGENFDQLIAELEEELNGEL